MKKIFKKTVWIAICSMAICLLTSCGKEKPQEKKVKDDHIEYETTKENGTTYEDEEAQTAEIQEGDIQNSKNKNYTDMAEEPFDWNALPIAKESDFEWKDLGSSRISITRYLGSEEAFKVPSTIAGNTVVKISNHAFEEKINLKCVDFSDVPLEEIEESAFWLCHNLKKVALPDMPSDSIYINPFAQCTSLSEITFGEGSGLEIENGIIYSDTSLLFRIPSFADKNVVIREGTTELKHLAFGGNNIESVVMPDSVVSVDRLIFEECHDLKSVTLSANLKNISDDMFRGCRSLKEITIPEGVERIIGGAFLGCWSLESVNLPSTLTEIGSHCFGSCKSLTNITIPKNVSRIGEKAFSNCNALTDIYYSSSEQDWNAAVETDVFVTNESDAGVIDVTVHYNQ